MKVFITEAKGVIIGTIPIKVIVEDEVRGETESSIIVGRYYLDTKRIALYAIASSNVESVKAHINAQADFVAQIENKYFNNEVNQ